MAHAGWGAPGSARGGAAAADAAHAPAAGGAERAQSDAAAAQATGLLDLGEALLSDVLRRLPASCLPAACLACRALDAAWRSGVSRLELSPRDAGVPVAGGCVESVRLARFTNLKALTLDSWELRGRDLRAAAGPGSGPQAPAGESWASCDGCCCCCCCGGGGCRCCGSGGGVTSDDSAVLAVDEGLMAAPEGHEPQARLLAGCLRGLGGALDARSPGAGGEDAGGEDGGGAALASVTSLRLRECNLDVGALDFVLARLPSVLHLELDGSCPPPRACARDGCPAHGRAPAAPELTAAAAEAVARRATRLEALSVPGAAVRAAAAAALSRLPRLAELEAARAGGGGYDPAYGYHPSCAAASEAAAAWRALPAGRLRALEIGFAPPVPGGAFLGWCSLLELRLGALYADQWRDLAAGLPRLRLLTARPKGAWGALACADGPLALPSVAHAEFWECMRGFASAPLASLLPGLEHLLIDPCALDWHEGCLSGCGEGGYGVDLRGLGGLRSLVLSGFAPAGPGGWGAVGAMPRLARLSCAAPAALLLAPAAPVWAAAPGQAGGGAEPRPPAVISCLGAAAASLEWLELEVRDIPATAAGGGGSGGRGPPPAPALDLSRVVRPLADALPALRALALDAPGADLDPAGLSPFPHPALRALALSFASLGPAGGAPLAALARAPLQDLWLNPGAAPSPGFTPADLFCLCALCAQKGLAVRRAPGGPRGGGPPYACGWRPYRGWREEERARWDERPGAAAKGGGE